MSERPSSATPFVDEVDRAALHAFMNRVRATLGHDLRTPLATIANYATLLEDAAGRDDSERRDVARRICAQATQTAEMLAQLLDATLVAASVPALTPIDPNALLRSIVAEIDATANLRGPERSFSRTGGGEDGPPAIELEAEVVGFAWRAFLRLEQHVASRPLSAARTTVVRGADRVRLELTFDGKEVGGAAADLDAFLGGGEVELPAPLRFGLQAGCDLVAARGGALELRGRIGSNAAMRLEFPRVR